MYFGYLNLVTFRRAVRSRWFRAGIALLSISVVLFITLVALMTRYLRAEGDGDPMIEAVGSAQVKGIAWSVRLAFFCFVLGSLCRVLAWLRNQMKRNADRRK